MTASEFQIQKYPRQTSHWEEGLIEGKPWFGFSSVMSEGELKSRVKALISGVRTPHLDWLNQENPDPALHQPQRENLKKIVDKNCLYIFTGQQPSLLGGPLLWWYKGLTAVALAKWVEKKVSYPVVPIFWIASDDDDFAECGHFETLEPKSSPIKREFPGWSPEKGIPLGEIKFPAEFSAWMDTLRNSWTQETVEYARKFCGTDETLSSSFRKLAGEFLGPSGLLFLEGNSSTYRKLANPHLKEMIQKKDLFETAFAKTNSLIEKNGTPLQAYYPPGICHAFALKDGKRKRFNEVDMTELESSDMELTHDAVSRTVVLDRLFPVVGHVLGPNEMGYFCQLSDVFSLFTDGKPLVFPRLTGVVLSQKWVESFHSIGIANEDLPELNPGKLKGILQEKAWKDAIPSLGPTLKERAEVAGDSLMDWGSKILGAARISEEVDTRWKEAVLNLFHKFEKTMKDQIFSRNKILYQDLVEKLSWSAFGHGQDRHLNILSLVEILGVEGCLKLAEAFDPLDSSHQIVVVK